MELCHPSIWEIITKIRLEVSNDESKLAQNSLGTLSNKKKERFMQSNKIN